MKGPLDYGWKILNLQYRLVIKIMNLMLNDKPQKKNANIFFAKKIQLYKKSFSFQKKTALKLKNIYQKKIWLSLCCKFVKYKESKI